MALATSGERFEEVLSEGVARGLVDDLSLRLLERRLSAARMSSAGSAAAGRKGRKGQRKVGNEGDLSSSVPEEELAAVRGLAVLWQRLKGEVDRQGAPPAERAIDDALRELASSNSAAEGRERAEKVLRRAAGLLSGRIGGVGRGSRGSGGGGGGGGIDILAVAAASERLEEEEKEKEEEDENDPSSSAAAQFPSYQLVPVAVIAATCSSLLSLARGQAEEVERALRVARESGSNSSSSSSSSASSLPPAFARAERLVAERRELVVALQEVLDVVNGL